MTSEISYKQDSLWTPVDKIEAEWLSNKYSNNTPATLRAEGHNTFRENGFSPFFHSILFFNDRLRIRFLWKSGWLKFTWWGLFA